MQRYLIIAGLLAGCAPALPALPEESDALRPDRIEVLSLLAYEAGQDPESLVMVEPVTVGRRLAVDLKLYDQLGGPLGNQVIEAVVVESESWESLASFPFGPSCRTGQSDGRCQIRILSTGLKGILKLQLRAVSRPDVDTVLQIDLAADRESLEIDFVVDGVGLQTWKTGFADPLRTWTLPGLNRDDPRPMIMRFVVRDDLGNSIDDVPVHWEILSLDAEAPPPPPPDAGSAPDLGLDRDVAAGSEAGLDGAVAEAGLGQDSGAGLDSGQAADGSVLLEGGLGLDSGGLGDRGAVADAASQVDAGLGLDSGTGPDMAPVADGGSAPVDDGRLTLRLQSLKAGACDGVDLPEEGRLAAAAEGLCLIPGERAGRWRIGFRWPGLVRPDMMGEETFFRLDGVTRDSQPVAIHAINGAGDLLDEDAGVLLCQPGGPTDLARFRVVGAGGGGIEGVDVQFAATNLEGVAPESMRSSSEGVVYSQAICPNRNAVDSYLSAAIPELRLEARREVLVTPSDVDQLVVYGDGEARVNEVVTPAQRPFGLVVAGVDANGARMPEMEIRFRVMSVGHQDGLVMDGSEAPLHGQVLNSGRVGQVHLRLLATGLSTLGRPIQLLIEAVDRPVQKLLLIHIVPGLPARVEVSSGSPIHALVGGSGGPLEVSVLDAAGNGVPGIPIRWSALGEDPEAALPEGIYLSRTAGRTDALGVFRSWVTGLTRSGTLQLKAWASSEQPAFEGTTTVTYEVGAGQPERMALLHRGRRLFDQQDGTVPFELSVGTSPVDPLVVRIENAQGGGMPNLGLAVQLISGEPADCGRLGEGALQTDEDGEIHFGADQQEPFDAGPRVALCQWRLSHGASGIVRTLNVGQVAGPPVGGVWTGHGGRSLISYVASPPTFDDDSSVELTLAVTDRDGQPRVGTRVFLNGINCWVYQRIQTTDAEGRARWRVAGGRAVGSCTLSPDWMGAEDWEDVPELVIPVGRADAANILRIEPRRINQQTSHTLRLYTENVRRPFQWANGEDVDDGRCYEVVLDNPYETCPRAQLLRAERAGPHGWSYTYLRDLPLYERFEGATPVHELQVKEAMFLDGGHFAIRLMQEDATLGNIFNIWVEPTHYWRGDYLTLPNPADHPTGQVRIRGGHRLQWDDDAALEMVVCGLDDRGGILALVNPSEEGALPAWDEIETLRTWHCQMSGDNCAPQEWPYTYLEQPGSACIVSDLDEDGVPDVLVPTNTSVANPVPRLLAFRGRRDAPYFHEPVSIFLGQEARRRAPQGIAMVEGPRRIGLCYSYSSGYCTSPSRGVVYQSTIEFQGNPFSGDPQSTVGGRLDGLHSGLYALLNDHRYTVLPEPQGVLGRATTFRKGIYSMDGAENGLTSRHLALDVMIHPDGGSVFYFEDYAWGGRATVIRRFGMASHREDLHLPSYRPLQEVDPENYNWERPLKSSGAVMRADGRQVLLGSSHHLLVVDLESQTVEDRGSVLQPFKVSDDSWAKGMVLSTDGTLLVGRRDQHYEHNIQALDLSQPEVSRRWEQRAQDLGAERVLRVNGEPDQDLVAATLRGRNVNHVQQPDRVVLLRLGSGEILWNQVVAEGYDAEGALDISPDGRWLAVNSARNGVHVYDTRDGALAQAFKPCLRDVGALMKALQFVPGRAGVENSLLVVCANEPLRHVTLAGDYLREWAFFADLLRVTPDGRKVAVYGPHQLNIIDLDDSGLGACWWNGCDREGGLLNSPPGNRNLAQADHLPWVASYVTNGSELWLTTESARHSGCGDGVVQAPEQFDDGPSFDYSGWTGDCGRRCGDGIRDPSEDCDDGNDVDDDGCSNRCQRTYVELSLGQYHGCARSSAGETSCWGTNSSGQIGNGYWWSGRGGQFDNLQAGRTRVAGLGPVQVVVAGQSHSCALREAGDVYCWGSSHYGLLGPERELHQRYPERVAGLPERSVDLKTGGWSNCVQAEDDSIWCWGYVTGGLVQRDSADPMRLLGVGSEEGELSPLFWDIFHGTGCARLEDGTTRCWGLVEGMPGQNGNQFLAGAVEEPRHYPNLDALVGFDLGDRFLCGFDEVGDVFCTGSNNYGQTGLPAEDGYWQDFHQIESLSNIVDVAAGRYHSCALDGAGQAFCWGYENHGALGRGTADPAHSLWEPAPVVGDYDFEAIWAGMESSCARRTNGQYACWGAGRSGQLNTWWNIHTSHSPMHWIYR